MEGTMGRLIALLLGILTLIDRLDASAGETLPTKTSRSGLGKELVHRNLGEMIPPLRGLLPPPEKWPDDRLVADPLKMDVLLSPASAQIGSIYPLVEGVMRPIMQYFDSVPAFFEWHKALEFHPLPRDIANKIAEELNRGVTSMKDLEEFWKRILGAFIPAKTTELKERLSALDKELKIEALRPRRKELQLTYRGKISGDRNIYENALQMVDNLSLGVRNYNQRLPREVFGPFLNAAIYFKELQEKIGIII
jgi:hypothetical protein